MSCGEYRFKGSPTRIYFIKSLASWLTKFGIVYFPIRIFLYSSVVSGSSNGKNPHIKAKRIIPQDHVST